MDLIERQDVLSICRETIWNGADDYYPISAKGIAKKVKELPSVQPETCEGCKHLGKWENEVEYGYPSPCTRCKRRVEDHYER